MLYLTHKARGGNGNELLGWCRKALSVYTWCRTNQGPQTEWLFKFKKADTGKCKFGKTMTGTHVVEECGPVENAQGGLEGVTASSTWYFEPSVAWGIPPSYQASDG